MALQVVCRKSRRRKPERNALFLACPFIIPATPTKPKNRVSGFLTIPAGVSCSFLSLMCGFRPIEVRLRGVLRTQSVAGLRQPVKYSCVCAHYSALLGSALSFSRTGPASRASLADLLRLCVLLHRDRDMCAFDEVSPAFSSALTRTEKFGFVFHLLFSLT